MRYVYRVSSPLFPRELPHRAFIVKSFKEPGGGYRAILAVYHYDPRMRPIKVVTVATRYDRPRYLARKQALEEMNRHLWPFADVSFSLEALD